MVKSKDRCDCLKFLWRLLTIIYRCAGYIKQSWETSDWKKHHCASFTVTKDLLCSHNDNLRVYDSITILMIVIMTTTLWSLFTRWWSLLPALFLHDSLTCLFHHNGALCFYLRVVWVIAHLKLIVKKIKSRVNTKSYYQPPPGLFGSFSPSQSRKPPLAHPHTHPEKEAYFVMSHYCHCHHHDHNHHII